ncbi:MAG TPA: DUF2846 domain-containing protein [Burkholderiales bacterium]|nr:DUF2846 domain-containing protein [Burkholderiales bacterium]
MNLKSTLACALIAIASGLTGCGTASLAPASADTTAKLLQPPPEGKAVIYLFRNSPPSYGWVIPVTLDGKDMGVTNAQTYFRWEVAPGEHMIISRTVDWSGMVINAEGGKTYYVWQDIGVGLFVPTSELKQVDRITTEINLRSCYLLENKT